MTHRVTPGYEFDRPIIIVAAPRSGSTLLFETLSRAQSLWTIGGESHMIFEHIDKLSPQHGVCKSNRLVAADADSTTIEQIREAFLLRLRNAAGRLYTDMQAATTDGKPRFLEKTPKNSLRIPFLEEVFPDARYIYLFRDPRENLSSMIEAWRSSDFVTYTGLPDWHGPWSLLLPPDYTQVRGKTLEEVVAFQWQAANQTILEDLGELAAERWTAVSYAELIADASATVERLCRFGDIPFDAGLKTHCETSLPLSSHTATAPQAGKWRMNATMIERVMPALQPLIARIEAAVAAHSSSPVLHSGTVGETAGSAGIQPQRNARCPCGSGLRFKHCHGILQATQSRAYGTEG
jgi:LPS sulfotransferase NodH